MKKFSKKGLLLFTGVMAVCAFALPAMSSAASWGVIGSEHTLHSPDVGFTSQNPVLGPITSSCAESTITVDVRSAAALNVTSVAFRRCTAFGPGIGTCTATSVATPSPNPGWAVTGVSTSNVQIDNVNVDVRFENPPGQTDCTNVNGASIVITGNLTGGAWNAAQHEVVYTNAEGLVSHSAVTGNNTNVTIRATFRDTAQSLTLLS
jgi:hypothetical protein